MPDPEVPHHAKRGNENAYKIIFWATIILLLCCLGGWLVFKYLGGGITPRAQPNPEPHSMLVMPAPERTPLRLG